VRSRAATVGNRFPPWTALSADKLRLYRCSSPRERLSPWAAKGLPSIDSAQSKRFLKRGSFPHRRRAKLSVFQTLGFLECEDHAMYYRDVRQYGDHP
jgi:hypothetical protein